MPEIDRYIAFSVNFKNPDTNYRVFIRGKL